MDSAATIGARQLCCPPSASHATLASAQLPASRRPAAAGPAVVTAAPAYLLGCRDASRGCCSAILAAGAPASVRVGSKSAGRSSISSSKSSSGGSSIAARSAVGSPGSAVGSPDSLKFGDTVSFAGSAGSDGDSSGTESESEAEGAGFIALAADQQESERPSAEAGPEPFYEPQFELLAASKVVPHPAKVEKGGEDAHLISRVGAGVICVADGVGGWAGDGIDPALYSREFVQHLQGKVEAAQHQEDLEPRSLLQHAHNSTTSPGASTAIVVVFDGEKSALQIANLGDCGALIVRRGDVIFRTRSQQHYFDCPYQFGQESTDNASDAEMYSVELVEGDTVVVASDGLFDNVFDRDIASVVKVFGGQNPTSIQRTATALAALASKHASDKTYESPYVLDAIEQGKDLPVWEKMLGKKLLGGKVDDITVVVAQVVPASTSGRVDASAAAAAS